MKNKFIQEKAKLLTKESSTIPMQSEIYFIHTRYEDDGYNTNYNYEFANKEEFLKFVHGERATDR